jgi:hypothetical protein
MKLMLKVLTIFQSEKIAEAPASCLAGGLELLGQYNHLANAAVSTNLANALPQSGAPQTGGGGHP